MTSMIRIPIQLDGAMLESQRTYESFAFISRCSPPALINLASAVCHDQGRCQLYQRKCSFSRTIVFEHEALIAMLIPSSISLPKTSAMIRGHGALTVCAMPWPTTSIDSSSRTHQSTHLICSLQMAVPHFARCWVSPLAILVISSYSPAPSIKPSRLILD